jgi:ATP-dependent DNA helicase RecG
LAPGWHQVEIVLSSCEKPATLQQLMTVMEWKDRSKFSEKYVTPLLEEDILAMTIPQKLTSSRQHYYLT